MKGCLIGDENGKSVCPNKPATAEDLVLSVEKDVFCGEQRVVNFSAQLALQVGQSLSDNDIGGVLGMDAVPAFRYAERSLSGFVRRTTGEPALCHSAYIALRALDLGYPQRVVQVALLHDTVEDRSRNLLEISQHLSEIRSLFGEDVARDVRCSTNVYSTIIRGIESALPRGLAFDDSTKPVLADALSKHRSALGFQLADEYDREYRQLLDYFLGQIDLRGGERKARLDKKYTVVSELRLQSYRLFVEDIHDDARLRIPPRDSHLHEVILVVKALDLVDNLRTSEVANFGSLERILLKVETFLDCTFFLHEYIHQRPDVHSTFINVYDYLKCHLVEQLIERKRAMMYLADTRFAFVADYLVKQISHLQAKYKVSQTIPELTRTRQAIREQNQVA